MLTQKTSVAEDTLLFKNAVKDLEAFTNSDVAIETIAATPLNSIEIAEVYRVLRRRYSNWEIAYENIDDFLDMFWERIEIHSPNYFLRKRKYIEYTNLTDEQLLMQSKVVSNFVEATSVQLDEPFDVLPNVTNQNATKSYGDYANRLRSQISAVQLTLLDDYLNKFKSLFIRATSKTDFSN